MLSNELQELAIIISQALSKGESREKVVADLTNNGWEQEPAENFVNAGVDGMTRIPVQHDHKSADSGMGWLIWIAALLLINALSYAFDWGFWLY